jgi:hypothetical protein
MQKSAFSGSISSNLIAGISPHVRRVSVWAFLKTVTTALHSDFLCTTQEKHPLLTCIALNSLNLFTHVYVRLLHHARIAVTRTTRGPDVRIWTPLKTGLTFIYHVSLHLYTIAPYYATPQAEGWWVWMSKGHEGRWPNLETAISHCLPINGHHISALQITTWHCLALVTSPTALSSIYINTYLYLCHTQYCTTQLHVFY